MEALDGDFALIAKSAAEVLGAVPRIGDDCAGIAGDEEFWNLAIRKPSPVSLHDGDDVGRFAIDRNLSRPNKRRQPRHWLGEWRPVGRHLLVGELAHDRAWQHHFDEGIIVQDHMFPGLGAKRTKDAAGLAKAR